MIESIDQTVNEALGEHIRSEARALHAVFNDNEISSQVDFLKRRIITKLINGLLRDLDD